LVCRNPLLAEERPRKRADLLRATGAALTKLADKTAGGDQRKANIARAVSCIENRYKLAKHFDIAVTEDGFSFHRNQARINQAAPDRESSAAEAQLNGFYVLRTSLGDKALAADDVVGAYNGLARVERAT
jgi:hypothetical protein